jgi:hypothetical protein
MALVLLVFAAFGLLRAQDSPLTQAELTTLLRAIEASKPSEDLVETIRQRLVDFEVTAAVRAELERAAARRPADLAELVRLRRIVVPFAPRFSAGLTEQARTLIWPPQEPAKPRFSGQLWRVPRANVQPAPLNYDPLTVRGSATFNLGVDGRVLAVLKHQTLFYNVICSQDLEVRSALFTQPLPRVPLNQLEYDVSASGKPRGRVFACPFDQRCALADSDQKKDEYERQCSWTDLPNGTDDYGYPPVRFLVDDPQKGSSDYLVTLNWALRPFTFNDVADALKTQGPIAVATQVYARGASFLPDATQEQALRDLGADNRVIGEIKGNQRKSNARRP